MMFDLQSGSCRSDLKHLSAEVNSVKQPFIVSAATYTPDSQFKGFLKPEGKVCKGSNFSQMNCEACKLYSKLTDRRCVIKLAGNRISFQNKDKLFHWVWWKFS